MVRLGIYLIANNTYGAVSRLLRSSLAITYSRAPSLMGPCRTCAVVFWFMGHRAGRRRRRRRRSRENASCNHCHRGRRESRCRKSRSPAINLHSFTL